MDSRRKNLLILLFSFLKIGAFTFGGGYAMIPLIQKEIAEKRKWVTDEDILDIIAIAESTPGPIAINAATFVGFKVCGFWGAFVSTVGIVLPSFLIISLISLVLKEFEQIKVVRYAFYGIRAGIMALIIKALFTMYKKCPKKVISYVIAAGAFVLTAILRVNAIFVIIACGTVGLIYSMIAERSTK